MNGMNGPSFDTEDPRSLVQSIFSSTRCYDLMHQSSKVIVFETCMSFQLAFYALVEHDTEAAPLWDPEHRTLVGILTMSDYIRTLQTFFQKKIPPLELSSKTIADLMTSDSLSFRQKGFQSIDAEDSVQQLYMQIQRQGVDYVPVVDPDTGSLVSVLGYLDLGHLLDEAAKQHPRLFGQTVEMICNDRNKREEPQITAPRSANLAMVLEAMEERNMTAIPVLDESNCVVGLYYRTDVAFITRAANADAIMSNLEGLTVGEALQQQQQQQQQQSVGEAIARVHPTVRCGPTHLVSSVLNSMMMARTTIVVCVGEGNLCLGTISIADILRYFFDDLLR